MIFIEFVINNMLLWPTTNKRIFNKNDIFERCA